MDFQSPMPVPADDAGNRLSPTGHLIGWAVFGSLVVTGFIFGVVTGYDRPRMVVAAKPAKESDSKAESPKPETPKVTPKPDVVFIPSAPAKDTRPISVAPPQEDPKKEDPKKEAPKAAPKSDPPKPPMPAAIVPPKKEPAPAPNEDVKPVAFKEVLAVLRTHCLNCHGAAGKPKDDVDLTTVAKMRASPGKVIVPGKPDQSDIYTSITERDMPKNKPKPSKEEMAILRNWILSGAKERRRGLRRRASRKA